MCPVTSGKRAGSRRGGRSPRKLDRAGLLICVGITLCVIAWGYLVYAAIDFGTAARGGSGASTWALMGLAALGAIACLFIGLLLVARLMTALGSSSSASASSASSASSADAPPPGPRPVGGKRAAR